MIREQFIGRNPSHFQINPIVKAFIISEGFIWSAWNFITPIIAVFVAENIQGGNIRTAAFAFSTYLISRVMAELICGRSLSKTSEKKRLKITIVGLSLISVAYIGFSVMSSINQLFLMYMLAGIGIGIASPAKNSIFSQHLDKDKEPMEWSAYDAFTFLGMALATSLGGFIASQYGFPILFVLASVINALGIIPYLLYIR